MRTIALTVFLLIPGFAAAQSAPSGGAALDTDPVNLGPFPEVVVNACGANAITVESTTCDIGVGVAAPFSDLHVLGTSTSSVITDASALLVAGSSGAAVHVGSLSVSPFGVFLQVNNASNILGGGYPLLLNPADGGGGGGKVGIRTTTPDYQFHVVGAGDACFETTDGGGTCGGFEIEGDGSAKVPGILSGGKQSTALGVAAATFAATTNMVVLTGDAGGNSITTITGGETGQVLRIQFVDELITLVDNDSHTADTIDLVGTLADYVSVDNQTMILQYDGTSWYEQGALRSPTFANLKESDSSCTSQITTGTPAGTLAPWVTAAVSASNGIVTDVADAAGDSITVPSDGAYAVSFSCSIKVSSFTGGDTDLFVGITVDGAATFSEVFHERGVTSNTLAGSIAHGASFWPLSAGEKLRLEFTSADDAAAVVDICSCFFALEKKM